MKPIRPHALALAASGFLSWLAVLTATAAASDWPQWRGPMRNGIVPDSPSLADQWPSKGLTKLWDSEKIPSNDDGGHGSVVAARGRVYAAIVWHSDVPTETRAIDDAVMRTLGYASKTLVEKMEKDRLALDPKMTDEELDKFIDNWIEKNLDWKTKQTSGGFVRGRFATRGDAIPLEVYNKLLTVSKTRFPNEAALAQWVDQQGFSEKIRKQIMAAVPPTLKVAEDVVICLDLATGKTLWKCKAPGEPTGYRASSTPCVADGRVYALGSTHFHAVDATTGKLLWSMPLTAKGPASSPMVVDGVLVVNAGILAAYDAVTGKPRWTQPKAGGGNSSPVAWKSGDKTVILVNGRGVLAGVDLGSGKILWTTSGGGDCTPAIVGDAVALQTSNPKVGILAGKLTATGFTRLWNVPYDPLRSQASPLILGNQVYLMDDNLHWCFDLATGRELWKEKVMTSAISSPVYADGKVFLVTGNGAFVVMLKPSPERRIPLAKARARAMWVPSPAIVDGQLLLRGRQGISCFALSTSSAQSN